MNTDLPLSREELDRCETILDAGRFVFNADRQKEFIAQARLAIELKEALEGCATDLVVNKMMDGTYNVQKSGSSRMWKGNTALEAIHSAMKKDVQTDKQQTPAEKTDNTQ